VIHRGRGRQPRDRLFFSLSIGYLWYNLIGCAACIAFSLLLQAVLGRASSRRRRQGMSTSPIIAFGQQPCGFFPRRFLFRQDPDRARLREQMAGASVYFCHDSDHDPRETRTILRRRGSGDRRAQLRGGRASCSGSVSPLYAKRTAQGWHERTLSQLPNYVRARTARPVRERHRRRRWADFCSRWYPANGAARRG